MTPFNKDEPKVRVESRTTSVNIELVLISGLIVLLLGVMSGL